MERGLQIEKWFIQFEKDVTHYLVYYTGSIDVEDLVQETFFRAVKKLNECFKEGEYFGKIVR